METDWKNLKIEGPILRPLAASEYLGVSLSHFYALVSRGELPPLIKLSRQARASGLPKPWLDQVLHTWVTNSLGDAR